jgi:hypothetical protein
LKATVTILVGKDATLKQDIQKLYLMKQTIDEREDKDTFSEHLEKNFKFMDFLEKDERDYISNIKNFQDYIKLLFARAFIKKLKPGDKMV